MKHALDYAAGHFGERLIRTRPKLKSTDPITPRELRELRALHRQIPGMSVISFVTVLTTPHLLIPLRRTLDAQKRAVAERKP